MRDMEKDLVESFDGVENKPGDAQNSVHEDANSISVHLESTEPQQ